MSRKILRARNAIWAALYRWIGKPLFFQIDPERIHEGMVSFGALLGRHTVTRWLTQVAFYFADSRLTQTITGVTFPNPVGLAGGFDKDARLIDLLPYVGFGFIEVGSITAKPYPGNLGRRLWRLPKSKSLVVNYGLKNDGADAVAERIAHATPRVPLFINIAKTNSADTCDLDPGVDDYVYTHRRFQNIGQADTINVSCPNAFGGQPFHEPERLKALLTKLDLRSSKKPAFIKISPDLDASTIDAIVDLSIEYGAAGIICTNLTKKRDPSKLKDANVPDVGGMSGKLVDHLSDDAIKRVYRRSQGRLVVIGLGGIFSAEDAYRKIRNGASLVQLITGMIYEGPQLISDINLGLVRFLERDGFRNISEAVGKDA